MNVIYSSRHEHITIVFHQISFFATVSVVQPVIKHLDNNMHKYQVIARRNQIIRRYLCYYGQDIVCIVRNYIIPMKRNSILAVSNNSTSYIYSFLAKLKYIQFDNQLDTNV